MSYIVTYKGHKFDYLNIGSNIFDIEDAVHSLANQNRYLGHAENQITVLEHSLIVYNLVVESYGKGDDVLWHNRRPSFRKPIDELEIQYIGNTLMAALSHDFTETYVGDMPAPLKQLIPSFKEIELEIGDWILDKLKIVKNAVDWERIKDADILARHVEHRVKRNSDISKIKEQAINLCRKMFPVL